MFNVKELEIPDEAEIRRSSDCKYGESHQCPADADGFYWDLEGELDYCFCDCDCHELQDSPESV